MLLHVDYNHLSSFNNASYNYVIGEFTATSDY